MGIRDWIIPIVVVLFVRWWELSIKFMLAVVKGARENGNG
jgi:hypothetical protein